jgi:hypothetical protein
MVDDGGRKLVQHRCSPNTAYRFRRSVTPPCTPLLPIWVIVMSPCVGDFGWPQFDPEVALLTSGHEQAEEPQVGTRNQETAFAVPLETPEVAFAGARMRNSS